MEVSEKGIKKSTSNLVLEFRGFLAGPFGPLNFEGTNAEMMSMNLLDYILSRVTCLVLIFSISTDLFNL